MVNMGSGKGVRFRLSIGLLTLVAVCILVLLSCFMIDQVFEIDLCDVLVVTNNNNNYYKSTCNIDCIILTILQVYCYNVDLISFNIIKMSDRMYPMLPINVPKDTCRYM